MPNHALTIKEIIEGYKAREFSPVEITKNYIQRIKQFDSNINAFITLTEEMAIEQAVIREKQLMLGGDLEPLFGIPITYKDNIDTKGILTTNGSAIDKNYIPLENAQVVKDLNRAGAVNLGKVNLYEYAFGITSTNPFYGDIHNPWNKEYMAGGSSSGSAAAVAANLCIGSIGTDTAGSIRVPAASCGVVGLKPTYNQLSTSGIMPLSWTLDHVGPITRNVEDLSYMMTGLTGISSEKLSNTDIRRVRIGIPKQYFTERIDATVKEKYIEAIQSFESLGAIVKELDMPFEVDPIKVATSICTSEVGYIHKSRRDSSLHLYGEGASEVFKNSDAITAFSYIEALKQRQILTQKWSELYNDVDVILTPTTPAAATKLGVEKLVINGEPDTVDEAMIRFTCLFDITGHPALTLPCGQTENNLPIGIQLVGNHNAEELLIKIAFAYEQNNLLNFYRFRDSLF